MNGPNTGTNEPMQGTGIDEAQLADYDNHDVVMFAGMAMMGMCSKPTIGNAVDLARTAWKVADAMVAEGKRRDAERRGAKRGQSGKP